MRDLLDIKRLSGNDIFTIVESAFHREYHRFPHFTALNVFMEPSTRTRYGFEIAEMELGIPFSTFTPETSSMVKRESFLDTMGTLSKLNHDIVVVRSNEAGLEWANMFSENTVLINAGNGAGEHPTQALLDLATIVRFGGENVKGKVVTIIGDVSSSRVAHSDIELFRKVGMLVNVIDVKYKFNPNTVRKLYQETDFLIVLRSQKERHPDEDIFFQFRMRDFEYLKGFLMHPGPFLRGVEVEYDVPEHPKSLIYEQVKMGLEVRRAAIRWCISAM